MECKVRSLNAPLGSVVGDPALHLGNKGYILLAFCAVFRGVSYSTRDCSANPDLDHLIKNIHSSSSKARERYCESISENIPDSGILTYLTLMKKRDNPKFGNCI